jgi:NADH:ubiquinone reductase (H+-translocating)
VLAWLSGLFVDLRPVDHLGAKIAGPCADPDSFDRMAPRVVVVGAGFAGLEVVRGLRGSGAEVTLVDRNIYSTFQPLLYQVATGGLNPGDVAYLIRGAVRKIGARFRHGSLATVDHASREAVLDSGSRLPYDHLVLATGVTTNYFGVPGAAENAHGLYRHDEAIRLRDLLMGELEALADRRHSDDADLSLVVVGGGATGVEMAGTLAELRNVGLRSVFPEIDHDRVAVRLVEQAPELLGPFHPKLRSYARAQLEKRGVEVLVDSAIAEVRPDSVVLGNGETLRADLTIWAAGVTAPAAVASWDVPQSCNGRIVVDHDFRVVGRSGVYAVGDIAVCTDRPLPQLAQPAIQGGAYVGRLLRAELTGSGPPRPFRYRNKGTLATIGRASAIAELPLGIRLTGPVAWLVWVAVHIASLLGGRNRVSALINLSWRYLAWPSGSGIIVGDTRTKSAPSG